MTAPPPILLVDDDISVLDLTRELLIMSGFDVVTADDPHAALARIAAGERFAALVTDHTMPGLSGPELITRARGLAPGLPCLLVTGHGDTVDTGIAVRVLRKPYRAAQLAAAVEAVIEAGV